MSSNLNVGHGILSIAAGESHLLNVCVHPDFQGHGFGRILVEHVLERARAGKASTIFLEVRPSNVAACELYDKLGFNEVGIRENYYPSKGGREDALVLAKELF
jgi:ribosomal-protein-alanine N-acetyltransferase